MSNTNVQNNIGPSFFDLFCQDVCKEVAVKEKATGQKKAAHSQDNYASLSGLDKAYVKSLRDNGPSRTFWTGPKY